jgi:hypothetical protein
MELKVKERMTFFTSKEMKIKENVNEPLVGSLMTPNTQMP